MLDPNVVAINNDIPSNMPYYVIKYFIHDNVYTKPNSVRPIIVTEKISIAAGMPLYSEEEILNAFYCKIDHTTSTASISDIELMPAANHVPYDYDFTPAFDEHGRPMFE